MEELFDELDSLTDSYIIESKEDIRITISIGDRTYTRMGPSLYNLLVTVIKELENE